MEEELAFARELKHVGFFKNKYDAGKKYDDQGATIYRIYPVVIVWYLYDKWYKRRFVQPGSVGFNG